MATTNPKTDGDAAREPQLPFAFAKRHGVLVEHTPNGPHVVYRSGALPQSLAEVRRFVGAPLRYTAVDSAAFDARLQAAYESGAAMTMVEGLDDDTDLFAVAQQLPEPSDLLDSVDDAPIIRLINALLTQAIKNNASDIHIEPYENRLTVRFRIDGVLQEVLQSRRAVAPLVVSRVKVMSKLDIAEKRLPQDGRISLRIAGRAVDEPDDVRPLQDGRREIAVRGRMAQFDVAEMELGAGEAGTGKEQLYHSPSMAPVARGPGRQWRLVARSSRRWARMRRASIPPS